MTSKESTVKKKIPLDIHRMCEKQKLRPDCADMNIMYGLILQAYMHACVQHCTSVQYLSTSIVANDLFLQTGTAWEDSDCAVSSESVFLHLQPRIMIRTSVHAENLTNF